MKNSSRQELKEAAKNHKTTMGVLSVKNTINGQRYIEGSLNLESLVNRIKFLLNSRQFTQQQLQNDWIQYGEQAFTFETLQVIPIQENRFTNYRQEVAKAEKAAIAQYNAPQELYND
ncbi:GIY-YIG nuclease family protein [Chitinophaga arvensicola]|uniref:LuxR family transcriptional regulator n=1 Tax=Chitinophaga arvensicola TaxID=29529 RepID=A0A1I0S9B4_9BACT|nr:GIY-YIG nuclease family protein [Chitinophaga arvensicola]SEW52752.1 hypothetical protein SAMN04488122_5086 [Chitinophaga arvensicola]